MTPQAEVQTWLRVPGMLCTADVFTPLEERLSLGGEMKDVRLQGANLEEATHELLDESARHAGPIGVIGLSLGAIVTLAAGSREPDAFAAVVVMSTSARAPRQDQLTAWEGWADRTRAGDFARIARELSPPLWTSEPSAEHLAHGANMAHRVGPTAFLSQLGIQRSRHDLRPQLTNVASPVLVLAGTDDQLCPLARHQEIAEHLPHSRLEIISGAGHLLSIEQPQAVADRINYWWRSGPSRPRDHRRAPISLVR